MEVKMKHRIVGILVIVALAVIVIPMFFTRSGMNTNEPKLSAKIPAAPSQPQTELRLPPQPKTVDLSQQQHQANDSQQSLTQIQTQAMQTNNNAAPVVNATPIKTVVKSKTAAKAPIKSRAKPQVKATPASKTVVKSAAKKQLALPKAKGFSIQLGTFANAHNAKNLVAKLRKAGFTAYTKSIKHNKQNLVRVMIGPVSKRDQAESMIKSLQSKFSLKGIIVDYKV